MAPSRSSESRRPAVASVEVVGSGTVVVEVVLGTVDVDDVDVLEVVVDVPEVVEVVATGSAPAR